MSNYPSSKYMRHTGESSHKHIGNSGLLPHVCIYKFLQKAVLDAKEKNCHIIVGGAFNDEKNHLHQNHPNVVSMTSVMKNLGLVLSTCSPGEKTPPTYLRGRRTFDNISVSSASDLKPLVTGYFRLLFKEGFSSNHRGYFIHLHLKHSINPLLQPINKQKLSRKNWPM